MKKDQTCIIKIPADIAFIHDTVEQLLVFFQENLVLSEEVIFDIKVILNELIVNAIIHGDRQDNNKQVFIKAGICSEDKIYIIIEDEGEGIADYKEMCSSDDDAVLLDERGRGLKIVSCLCSSVKRNKKGNKVVVMKKI